MNELLQFLQQPTIMRDAVVALVGLCVGSFLNVLALRSLQENLNPFYMFYPPSHCPECEHRLGLADLIPVLSYVSLQGKCRYCQKQISWQYPLVEILTGAAFVTILHYFGATFEALGMVIFACTLIAITITDFREKLIPHEITYPSIVLGIIYSGMCASMSDHGEMQHITHDVIGSMVGIGICYLLFDFIAFYGGWLHQWMHRNDPNEDEDSEDPDEVIDINYGKVFPRNGKEEEFEEIEVMGGGDAVLGAVIAAWLGISRLGVALIVGFLLGALLGAIYLGVELKKQNMLAKCTLPCAIFAGIFLTVAEALLFFFAHVSQQPFWTMPWWQFGSLAIVFGGLLGVVRAGARVSKPFPFGPALAGGALVAMFYDPFTGAGGGA